MMPARKTNLPPASYTTFHQLAVYACKRAKISATRRGHQEFKYWMEVALWARQMSYHANEASDLLKILDGEIAITKGNYSIALKAEAHARAVHLRKLLSNQGVPTPRLSLAWLRNAAEVL